MGAAIKGRETEVRGRSVYGERGVVIDMFGIDGGGEFSQRMAGGDSQQVPGGMREPLLGPSPVIIFPGHGIRQIEIDIVLIVQPRSNPIYNPSRRIGIFKSTEEAVGRIVMARTLQHTGIEWVQAQDPVELVEREGFQGMGERPVAGKEGHSEPGRSRHRGEPGILSLPPGRSITAMGKEKRAMPLAQGILNQLTAITEGIVDLMGNRQLMSKRAADGGLYSRLCSGTGVRIII